MLEELNKMGTSCQEAKAEERGEDPWWTAYAPWGQEEVKSHHKLLQPFSTPVGNAWVITLEVAAV